VRTSRLRMHQRRKVGELALHQVQPSLVRKARAPGRNGRRITIDGHELPVAAKRFEDARTVPTAAECRIDVETARAQRQRLKRLLDKHRRVLIQLPSSPQPPGAASKRQRIKFRREIGRRCLALQPEIAPLHPARLVP
jgi:hypothetical protein